VFEAGFQFHQVNWNFSTWHRQEMNMRTIFCLVFLTVMACPVHARDTNGIRSETLASSTTSWNGAALPAYPEGEPEITILRVTIPPHASLPWHKHPFINAGVLLSGELTVETEEDKVLRLNAGDPIVELVNTWHHGINTGDVPAEIIVFYAGVKDMPVTVGKEQ
jgi:quercetin dioxygenase-like cupin family protein